MKKIVFSFLCAMLLLFTACSGNSRQKPVNDGRQIQIEGKDGQNIVFRLNDSPAAEALYGQLPLSTEVENYSDNEKIFYPPDELDISDTPLAKGPSGTLAYYAPWSDVVLFYGECTGAGGLYELGEAVSGTDKIESLYGEIYISAVSGE